MNLSKADARYVATEVSDWLKVLSHPDRMLLCCALKDNEMAVSDIEQELEIRQPRLSRELGKLRYEGFVDTRKESRVVFYQLKDDPKIHQLIDSICAVMLNKPVETTLDADQEDEIENTDGAAVFPVVSIPESYNDNTNSD